MSTSLFSSVFCYFFVYISLFLSFCDIGLAAAVVKAPLNLPPCPMRHITDAMMMKDGSVWVVGENCPIHRLELGMGAEGSWSDMSYFKDYPGNWDFRCVAQDKQGRVWAGSDNSGVAVFNGESWKCYDKTTALAGDHVFDIAVSPVSGEVAIATSGGVTVYDPRNESWKDLTRREGLVSDQVQALTFDKGGALWLAYACGGVSRGDPGAGYSKWETTLARWYWDAKQYVRQPYTSDGVGLPSNLCNAIFETKTGEMAVGTCSGLALRLLNNNWRFWRGADYDEKNMGTFEAKGSVSRKKNDSSRGLLSEDYITAISETDKGILVGFRKKGAALFNPKSYRVVKRYEGDEKNPLPCSYVTSLVPLPDGTVLGGTYGGGMLVLEKGKGQWEKEIEGKSAISAFPKEAGVLKTEEIAAKVQKLSGFKKGETPAVYWKEDWNTQGNWCGRYGNDYALLCAVGGGLGNRNFWSGNAFRNIPKQDRVKIVGRVGCHKSEDEALRHWIHSLDEPYNKNVLFELMTCHRLEAEWDDHGEAYSRTFDGPDVWTIVSLPKGVHAVSLYFYNPNGKDKEACDRDFLVEVRRFSSALPDKETFSQAMLDTKVKPFRREQEIASVLKTPVLARTRVKDFSSHGVYKTFLLQGGADYYIRVCRNYSFNTILNGVFVDMLFGENGEPYPQDDDIFEFMGMKPEAPAVSEECLKQYASQIDLWKASDKPVLSPQYLSGAEIEKRNLYRLSLTESNAGELASHWNWKLNLWTEAQRTEFEEQMLRIWYRRQDTREAYWRSSLVCKRSPRTIPFTEEEICVMGCLNIDWKQYLPNYRGTPTPSADEFRKMFNKMSKEDLQRLFAEQLEKYLKEHTK